MEGRICRVVFQGYSLISFFENYLFSILFLMKEDFILFYFNLFFEK